MANEITTSIAFVPPAAFLASSTFDATYTPAWNIGDYIHPSRPWWGANAASGTTWVGADLGASTAIAAVAGFGLNMTSLLLQTSATASFSSPTTQSVVTVPQDFDGLYKFYCAVSATARYWRILANTSVTTDSVGYMKCGALTFFSSVTAWPRSIGFPYSKTPLRAVSNSRFDGGGREPVVLGAPYAQIGISQPTMPLNGRTTVETVLRYGEHTPFLFYRNFNDTSEVYIMRRVGLGSWEQAGPGHFTLGSLLLESVC